MGPEGGRRGAEGVPGNRGGGQERVAQDGRAGTSSSPAAAAAKTLSWNRFFFSPFSLTRRGGPSVSPSVSSARAVLCARLPRCRVHFLRPRERPCRLAGGKTRPLVGRGCSSTQLANTRAPRRRFRFRSSRVSSPPTRDERPPTRLIKPLSSFCLSPDTRSRRKKKKNAQGYKELNLIYYSPPARRRSGAGRCTRARSRRRRRA